MAWMDSCFLITGDRHAAVNVQFIALESKVSNILRSLRKYKKGLLNQSIFKTHRFTDFVCVLAQNVKRRNKQAARVNHNKMII